MQPRTDATYKTLVEWVEALASEGPDGEAAWRQFAAVLEEKHLAFADALSEYPDEAGRLDLLRGLLFVIARSALGDWTTRNRIFDAGEAMGIHLLPIDFYSPVPDTRDLSEQVWTARWDEGPGFDWRSDEQLALLARLARWAPEMEQTPLDRPASPSQYYFNNPLFSGLDAAVHYAMIREFAPRMVIEVGAGFSTMVAAQAALRTGTTTVCAIDPFPSQAVRQGFPGLADLRVKRVQDVDIGVFEALQANDILFFDGTHVSKVDSDVNHLLLRVLPRLQAGVLIHIHDIYLPWDYERSLVLHRKRFWNEQYLVAAFLRFNETFRIMWASRYLTHVAGARVRRAFPFLPTLAGTSLWMQRVP